MSTQELGLHIGVHKDTCARHIKNMRLRGEPVSIRDWFFPDGPGRASPVYAYRSQGARVYDVSRPTQTENEQRRKRYAKNKVVVSLKRAGNRSKAVRLNNPFGLTAEDVQNAENSSRS